ncbi:unnamed protein product [Dracunculus medinensis]|uniref:Renin receptor-like C-terminal transmembrane spanning segment domain-containing protein n=1 Tax=Dracunculus medinensis TaxID=318479 RepID=A0A3P7SX65_DRAME|nr:unnamed protein product [Dracunculus medinensis]
MLNNEVNPSSIDHIFSTNFAENRIWAKIESKEIKGSNVFSDIESVKFNETMISISTMPLRRELILLYKLSEAVTKSLVSLSPALYIVQIDGLESAKIEAPLDYRNAMRELIEAIIYFISNLKNSYGNRAIVELIIRTNGDNTHSIEKRQVSVLIFQFTSEDYPAMFAIFAGCGIILSVSVFFIVVGLWNMDPGKDSIIYRMTTTRMKKD